MKKMLLTILCFGAMLFALPLSAQLAVDLKIAQFNYMPFEPVFARVSIRNFSAHAMAFGSADRLKGSLRFEIIPDGKSNRKALPPIQADVLPPLTGSIIPPGATQEYTFNLCDYYDLSQIGKYSIRAVIKHNMFREEYLSPDCFVSIVRGMKIWSMEAGVPTLTGAERPGQKVEKRTFSIYSYSTGQKTQVLNLQVEDKNMVYVNRRIAFDLGPELRPECQIDFLSRLNVIVAASNRVYAYYVFSIDGRLEKRKVLIKESAKPTLSVDPKTGYVTVVGGREAERDKDYQELQNLPFLGSSNKPGATTLPAPPKNDVTKGLNAVE